MVNMKKRKKIKKDPKTELYITAESQQGLFTAKQAEKAGFVPNNHAYHVNTGSWIREERGVYRLALFPISREQQLVTYALWSHNRKGEPQGVYSHETALSIYELSDVMPSKLHMSVPRRFRRSSDTPEILILHHNDLSKKDIKQSRGFLITTPIKTIQDIIETQTTSFEIIEQAILEALKRGLVLRSEIKNLLQTIKVSPEITQELKHIFDKKVA